MNKVRLDLYLVEHNYVPSRSKASEMIKNNKVFVNNKLVNKLSFEVDEIDIISISENDILKYVSRGGLKLEKAINEFSLNLDGLTILDIGASTGGFTDCALQNNAKKVYALDVGNNQLHESLLNNDKVINLENTNFKDINKDLVNEKIDLYVCDVSFISIMQILKKLKEFDENFSIVILFKPQFEVGKNNLNKNGVAKNPNVIIKALNEFAYNLKLMNIGIINATFSPIKGHKEGNIEYLFYLKNNEKGKQFDFEKIVNESYKVLKVK